MNTAQILKVYECVSKKDRSGISLLQISRETKIPGSLVRDYLSTFSNFFVSIGGSSRYTLNRLTNTNNTKESLVAQIQKTEREQAFAWFGFAIFSCGIAVAISVNVFNGS